MTNQVNMSLNDIHNEITQKINELPSDIACLGCKGRLIKVIKNYGKQQGLFNNIKKIAYRAWNALKAFFGCSDWQKMRNSLASSQTTMRISDDDWKTYEPSIQKKLLPLYKKLDSSNTEDCMRKFLAATYIKAPKDDFDSSYGELSIISGKLEKIQSDIDKILSN